LLKSPYEAFGVECRQGWKRLIDPIIDLANKKGIHITQIKEKFGTLRVYTDTIDRELDQLIVDMEIKSAKVCEVCGDVGKIRSGGWIKTLCDLHDKERKEKK
jgi:hypothetical protein